MTANRDTRIDVERAVTPQLRKETAKPTKLSKFKSPEGPIPSRKSQGKVLGLEKSKSTAQNILSNNSVKTATAKPSQRKPIGRTFLKHAISTSVDDHNKGLLKKAATLQSSPTRASFPGKPFAKGNSNASKRQAFAQANVKVVARIRPLNKKEEGLIEQGVGENFAVGLDHAFDRDTKQETVYERVGKPTVEDVLKGYNGTILAYGQTGSGKTYTMFGPDIYDEEKKGIIPRAACEIFQKWGTDINEVVISCSMLEIYKENLRDLLVDERNDELKIKESPDRGIWVEGLYEMPIGNAEELMYCIDIGESRRVWAETCHNAVSSRSHTLLMLEVRQFLTNGSEKRGLLNLVDLAGSEKVGKSGAQGELFVEGTKINLSLSALGNVIHALTSNLDHIPYRDSKLTRLLQESLGGNYKTTLIVTCAPHSSELAESMSTLKFAQRAKKLKNKVQMNIKHSPDQLLKVIDQLKEELRTKDEQIQNLLVVKPRQSSTKLHAVLESGKTAKAPLLSPNIAINRSSSVRGFELTSFHGEKPSLQLSAIPVGSSDKDSEIIRLTMELEEARKTIENLQKGKNEVEDKARKLEFSLVEEKKHTLVAETKITELEHIIATHDHKDNKEKLQENANGIQIKVLSNQIKALTEALDDAEKECFKLLKEKKEKLQKDTIELHSLNMIDYVSKSTLQTSFTTKWVKDLEEAGLDAQNAFIGPKSLFNHKLEVKLNEKKMMSTSKYSETLDSAVVEGYVSPETIIYLLKNQLIDAAILNHNLQRVVSLLAWKLHVEKSAAIVKNELGNMLQKTVDSLENLLTKTSTKHQTMKRKLEELGYEISQLKTQLITHKSFVGSFLGNKPRVRKPIKMLGTLKHSAFARSESRGLRLLRPGMYTPMGVLASQQKELRWDDVCRSRAKEDNRGTRLLPTTEEDDRPQIAEMDEEDEKKLEEVINQKKGQTPRLEITEEPVNEKILEFENLEHGLRDAQIDLAWHKTLTDLLMEELIQARKQANRLMEQIAEIKISSDQVIQDENRNWKMITDSLKENYDQELVRKQKEMSSLHDLLAQWIMKYMEMEKSKAPEHSSLANLLSETMAQSSTAVGKVMKKTTGK